MWEAFGEGRLAEDIMWNELSLWRRETYPTHGAPNATLWCPGDQ